MKVLHIITALGVGGAQSVLQQFLKTRKNDQDQYRVISLVGGGRVAEEIEVMGIPVQHLSMQPGRPYPSELLKLGRAIRAFQPDLIQTWLYHADLIGGIVGRIFSRAAVVWGIHHTLSQANTLKPTTFNVVRLNALLSGLIPARIICCSRTALESHVQYGYPRNKMLVIPNGIDTTRFHPDPAVRLKLRGELNLPDSTKIIGMFARFHPQKDHHNLIQAAGHLHRSMPEVHFVLTGDGVDENNRPLREWIAAEGFHGNVHLLGLRRDMPDLHAALDLFTLTSSDGEAQPLVIGEAMACGVPCVATEVGDGAEMIGNTGKVVQARDPQALAQAWASILELPRSEYDALSRLARERIQHHYNLENISGLYRDLYQQVIS